MIGFKVGRVSVRELPMEVLVGATGEGEAVDVSRFNLARFEIVCVQQPWFVFGSLRFPLGRRRKVRFTT